MQSIKQISDELTTIMLVVAREHGLELTDTLLEMIGRE